VDIYNTRGQGIVFAVRLFGLQLMTAGKRTQMRQPANVSRVYSMIQHNVGKRVLVRTNQGRNRFDEEEGVIDEMHPHIFCIKVDRDEGIKTLSFSYTDVLIKDVELVF